ncbi:MAG TPA: Yip1 family protein [Usitatibacter sp.]|nr:Yip1 family protein [Usitatibacter sp.]
MKSLVDRAKKLIVEPRSEWKVIAAEPHTLQELYTEYVMILAAIPAVATFIGLSIIGYPGFRIGIGAGVAYMALHYLLSLGTVYVLAQLVNALAPSFGGEKNFGQAFKVAAFAPTAAWLAGIFNILPALSILSLAGLYSLYLLFTGLGPVMRTPEDKTVPYTVVVILAALVLYVVVAVIANLAVPSQVRGF